MKNVKKRINEIKQKREEMITRIENKIEEAERDIRIANSEVTKAQSAGDFDAYDAALEEVRKARLRKQMYTEKLEAIKRDNVITDEEARILDKEIRKYVADEERKKLAQAQEIIRPLQKQYDDLSGTVKEANEALRVLHTELLHENSNPVVNAVMYFGHMHKVLNILNADLPESN